MDGGRHQREGVRVLCARADGGLHVGRQSPHFFGSPSRVLLHPDHLLRDHVCLRRAMRPHEAAGELNACPVDVNVR